MTWFPGEPWCDERTQRGNILLGSVTWPMTLLVETAQGKCERDLFIMS